MAYMKSGICTLVLLALAGCATVQMTAPTQQHVTQMMQSYQRYCLPITLNKSPRTAIRALRADNVQYVGVLSGDTVIGTSGSGLGLYQISETMQLRIDGGRQEHSPLGPVMASCEIMVSPSEITDRQQRNAASVALMGYVTQQATSFAKGNAAPPPPPAASLSPNSSHLVSTHDAAYLFSTASQDLVLTLVVFGA